jgi:simple sugar transport system ATP-binding protein
MPTSPTPLLSLRKVTKRYPGLIANDQIDLDVTPASIHAILGENGAGKSTLMKLVYGVINADEGSIYWQGKQVEMRNTAQARKLGIGMVFQHFSLFETMTVVENISMTVPGNRKQLTEKIISLGEEYNLSVNPQAEVHSLSVGERQRVEILRCLMQDLKLLILDEPTSVLPPQHVQSLFVALRKLQASGVAILYISHKLEEIRDLCDTATILQAGKVTGSVNPREKTSRELSVLMIGRNIPNISSNAVSNLSAKPRLQLNKLSLFNDDPFGVSLSDIDLKVHGGEIVGIAGVSGNGQQELSRIISGELIKQGMADDAIMMMDQPVTTLGVTGRRQLGFSFVPEERLGRGAVPPMSLADNVLLTAYEKDMLTKGFINRKKTTVFTQECIERYDVKCRDTHSTASSLSGGNLQKFIVGREIMLSAKLLFVSQPTWGVDIGAATAIRQRLLDLRDEGIAILVISEELEELFEISDRLHIISEGNLSPSFKTENITPEDVGEYMIGSRDIRQEQTGEAINAT